MCVLRFHGVRTPTPGGLVVRYSSAAAWPLPLWKGCSGIMGQRRVTVQPTGGPHLVPVPAMVAKGHRIRRPHHAPPKSTWALRQIVPFIEKHRRPLPARILPGRNLAAPTRYLPEPTPTRLSPIRPMPGRVRTSRKPTPDPVRGTSREPKPRCRPLGNFARKWGVSLKRLPRPPPMIANIRHYIQ